MKKGKILAALAAIMMVSGANVPIMAEVSQLDEVVVEADRYRQNGNESVIKPLGVVADQVQNVGLLGEKDALETPFNSMTLTRKDLDYFGSPEKGPTDMLTLNPAVRDASSNLYNDVSIRGFNLNGHNMYLNGIQGMLDQQHAADIYIDKATVIAGPNLGIVGTPNRENLGGTILFTSKKAQAEPNLDLTLAYQGGKSFKEAVDFGTRLGHNQRWGIRVMADNIQGETAIDGDKLTQRDFFVNIDQKTKKSKTNLLIGYNYADQKGAQFTWNFNEYNQPKGSRLPKAPDNGRSYLPEWTNNEYDNWIATLNHEQILSDHTTAFFNAGYHREDWYGYQYGTPRLQNANGDYTVHPENYPLAVTTKYFGGGIKGKFNLGLTKHNYVLSADRMMYDNYGGTNKKWGNNGEILLRGNMYTGYMDDSQYYMYPHEQGSAPWSSSQFVTGWHISDDISMFDDRLNVIVGLHGHHAKQIKKNGENKKYHGVNPTFGLNYKISENFSVYASHAEDFMIGRVVGAGYKNSGETLDPGKTKQNEFGFKYKVGDMLHTLSFFKIEQPNFGRTEDNYYGIFGKQKNKGFEYAFSGALGRKLDLIGGIAYVDAKQAGTGKKANGVPKWSGTAALIYKPTERLNILERATYQGSSWIINEKYKVPSHVLFDLGATYEADVRNTPITFKAMLYNVFGKDYWSARAGNSTVVLGTPRTFMFSATLHL